MLLYRQNCHVFFVGKLLSLFANPTIACEKKGIWQPHIKMVCSGLQKIQVVKRGVNKADQINIYHIAYHPRLSSFSNRGLIKKHLSIYNWNPQRRGHINSHMKKLLTRIIFYVMLLNARGALLKSHTLQINCIAYYSLQL